MASQFSTFLFVHLQGEPVTGDERLSAFGKVLRQATEADVDMVIHDDTAGAALEPVDYITRANFLGASEFKNRIAYVPPPCFSAEICGLIENAAWNYARRVRLFSRVEDAIDWIEHPDDDAG